MESLREEVNDMELKYWEKNENFWRLMFSCCVGFVSFVTPFLLGDKISPERQFWMRWSVVCGCSCAAAMIPILRRSIRLYRDLWLSGKRMVERTKPIQEVVLPIRSALETMSLFVAILSAIGAAACILAAMSKCS